MVLRGEALRLDLDASAPIGRTRPPPRALDSKLEAALDRDVRRLASPWRIERETGVVRDGDKIFFPDFALVSTKGRVLVEVVGFWTPEYLAAKARLLEAARAEQRTASGRWIPFVLCVDERHARGTFEARPDVLFFRERVDAGALIAACERALERDPPVSPVSSPAASPREGPTPTHHYLILPESGGYAAYAVRAGASREHWRREVLEDVGGGEIVRVARSTIDPAAANRASLRGRRFALEVGCDRLRNDALFVYRIGSARSPGGAREAEVAVEVAARFTMLASGGRAWAFPPADPVAPLFRAPRR